MKVAYEEVHGDIDFLFSFRGGERRNGYVALSRLRMEYFNDLTQPFVRCEVYSMVEERVLEASLIKARGGSHSILC
jgi:hypothetical protein